MRDYRYRFLGALYALTVLLWLAASGQFWSRIGRLAGSGNQPGFVMAAVGLVVVLLTSEAAGFLIFNMMLAVMNLDPKQTIYSRRCAKVDGVSYLVSKTWENAPALQAVWDTCSLDVRLNYFWQRAPNGHVQWVSRRHSAYLAHRGAITSMFLGSATGIAIIVFSHFCFSGWHGGVLLLLAFAGWAFYSNGKNARAEAEQLLTLWTKMLTLPNEERNQVREVARELGLPPLG